MTRNKDDTGKSSLPENGNDHLLLERINSAIKEREIAELEKKLDEYSNYHLKFRFIFIRIAALFLLISGITIVLWNIRAPEGVSIYNAFYRPYDAAGITGIYRDQPSGFSMAAGYYARGKYREALPLFRNRLIEKPDDQQARLLMAVCLMEEKKFPEAELALNEIINQGSGLHRADAAWYLALLYTRSGKNDVALSLLEEINGSVFSFQSDIESLKEKISGNEKRNRNDHPN